MAQTSATPKTSVSAEQLMSLPSISSGLSTLPQAKSIEAVSLHFGIHTERAVEREEKLKRAITKTAASAANSPPQTPAHYYATLPSKELSQEETAAILQMRKTKRKFHI